MVKGIRTVLAVMILTCLFGVSSANAQIPSTKLTSLDILKTSCMTDPQEFLYALRFGPKLGAKTPFKDVSSDASTVFASSKGKNSHFSTEITAQRDNNTYIIETTDIVSNLNSDKKISENISVTPSVTPASGGLDPEVLFNMANSHRSSLGLSPFEKNSIVCGIAASRGPELNAEMANGTLHAGLYSDGYPFPVTENMISMRNNDEAFRWWLNSPVHRGQLQGNYKYACAVCSGNTCALVFTNQSSN